MPEAPTASETSETDDAAADLTSVRIAAERVAARGARSRDGGSDPLERALPIVLGTVLGGLALAALGGLTGVISLGLTAVVVGIVVAVGAGVGLVRLGEAAAQREAAARGVRDEAAGDLMRAVGNALDHVERLDAERASLHRKIARLERRLAGKDRQLAKLQAFDAERRALGPAPEERPQAEQLTLEAVIAAAAAEESQATARPSPAQGTLADVPAAAAR